ncbi:MAG: ABC transporter permease [Bacteroidaceae bacterium]|nr:ABC transporter permease [Bacteroidaceae bacterium]
MRRKNDILIKVLSLGVGLAIAIVLIAKVFFELSYDSFYKNINQIYSIQTWYSMNGEEHDYGQVSGAVAVGFMDEVPGVEVGTRTTFVFNEDTYLDEDGNKITGTLVCADTCFFQVFNRPILAGDPVKALGKFGTLMVSRSFADKLVTSPGDYSTIIGKQIANTTMEGLKLTIEGVYEDFPKNGTLDYDILLSMDTYGKQSTDNWLGNDRYKGYVKLAPGVDPNSLKDAIRKMQEAHQPLEQLEKNNTSLRYFLSPFDKMHTSDPEVKSQVTLLSIVAALLLIISLLNYILMVISSMVKRSREVGVRKCYGAESKHIYGMLSREALLHLVLALGLTAVMIFAGRNLIENLLGVPFTTLLVPQSITAIGVVIALVLVISIVVPAHLYMRIPVYQALKNYTENSRKWKLGLLGSQVLINVFLVVMMLIIGRQYEMVAHTDTGYDYDNIYYISLFDGDRQAQVRAASTLQNLPEVKGVAASYNLAFQGSNGNNIYLPGELGKELFNIADQMECSDGFYDLFGIQFLEGRAPRDSSEVVVDEKFVEKMKEFTDWSDGAVGKQIQMTGHDRNGVQPVFTIAGVYKSYLIGNLTGVDERPSALFYGEIGSMSNFMPHIFFKLTRTDEATLKKVQQALSDALEGKEINLISYEDSIRDAYTDSKKMRNTLVLGAIFSLLIAMLGLIGFIRDESQRRSKEMAIRKINGATTRDILGIFAWDIQKLSIVMAIVAMAAAYYMAGKWLEQFAEKVTLHPLYFIGGALLVLLIVLTVVVVNCLRIAHANPVESLKNE